MAGIVGYGAYVPRNRIKTEEIARQWGKDPAAISRGLLLKEKTVPGLDEDTITISVAAARAAIGTGRARSTPHRRDLHRLGVPPVRRQAERHRGRRGPGHRAPTCTSPTSSSPARPAPRPCSWRTGWSNPGQVEYALAIGADTSQGAPNDALEFSASAGGAAYIFGKRDPLVEVLDTVSFTSDTPDFWRREGEFYPRHGGRFTGDPAYFKHVLGATRAMLEKTKLKPADFRYAVFHMPNGKFPLAAAKTLGFSREQVEQGWVVPRMGNTYSGSSPTGLAAVLDVAAPDDLILITSFGSGAASDSFVLRATQLLPERRGRAATVHAMLDDARRYLTYGEYAKYREKIILND